MAQIIDCFEINYSLSELVLGVESRMLIDDDLDVKLVKNSTSLALKNIKRVGDKVTDYSHTDEEGFPEDARVILDQIKLLPPVTDFKPREVRDSQARRGYPFDHNKNAEVEKREVKIPFQGGEIEARMYIPKVDGEKKSNSGALVYFHGGGFVLGSIDSHDGAAIQIANQSKLKVLSVNYRLAPESPFPAGLLDAQHSFNWLYQNAGQYDIDKDRIAIGGDSAGANLAAASCKLNRDQGKPMPAIQMLIYPSTIGNNSSKSREQLEDAPIIPKPVIQWMHDHYIPRDQANDERFNILAAEDLSDLPPAFVLTAGYDPLRDEGHAYAEKLRAHGVEVRYSCYTNMFHGFYTYGVLSESRNAVNETAKVLSLALG